MGRQISPPPGPVGVGVGRDVPVDDIAGFRRRKGDWHALGVVLVETRTHGTIKTAARMNGAARLTKALLGANDQLHAEPAWESQDPARRRAWWIR